MAGLFGLGGAFFLAWSNIAARKGMLGGNVLGAGLITLGVNVILYIPAFLLFRAYAGGPAVVSAGLLVMTLAGLVNTTGRFFFFAGISRIGPPRAAVFRTIQPILTLFIGLIVLGEWPGPASLIGLLAVVSGMFLLASETARLDEYRTSRPVFAAAPPLTGGASPVSVESPAATVPTPPAASAAPSPGGSFLGLRGSGRIGMALALGGALFFAGGDVVRKWALNLIPDPLLGSVVGSSVSFALVALLAGLTGRLGGILGASRETMGHYLWSGVLNTLGLFFYFIALLRSPAAVVAALVCTESLWSILLSRFLLRKDEIITPRLVISAVVVMGGAVTILLRTGG